MAQGRFGSNYCGATWRGPFRSLYEETRALTGSEPITTDRRRRAPAENHLGAAAGAPACRAKFRSPPGGLPSRGNGACAVSEQDVDDGERPTRSAVSAVRPSKLPGAITVLAAASPGARASSGAGSTGTLGRSSWKALATAAMVILRAIPSPARA